MDVSGGFSFKLKYITFRSIKEGIMEAVESFVKKTTREHAFDFDKVSLALNEAIKFGSVSNPDGGTFSAQDCREIFSNGYNAEEVVVPGSSMNVEVEVMPPAPPSDTLVREPPKNFKEALAFQKDLESETARRSEDVFSRVLTSLGGSRDTMQEAMSLSKEISDMLASREQAKADKAQRELDAQAEREEAEFLQKQKERLQNRFAPGSEDNEGENPLEEYMFKAQERPQSIEDTMMDAALAVVGPFKFDDILADPNFDRLLDELEADLDASAESTAVEKSGDSRAETELGEVLAFLSNVSAKNASTRQKSQDIERKGKTTDLSNDEEKPSTEGDAPGEGHGSPEADSSRQAYKLAAEARANRAARAKQVDSALERSMGIFKVSDKKDKGSSHTASTTTPSTSTIEAEDDDSDESDDDGARWMRQRNARKNQSMKVTADVDTKRVLGGAWGAFGASTVDTAAGRLAEREKQRTNPYYQAPGESTSPQSDNDTKDIDEDVSEEEYEEEKEEENEEVRRIEILGSDESDTAESEHDEKDFFTDSNEHHGDTIVTEMGEETTPPGPPAGDTKLDTEASYVVPDIAVEELDAELQATASSTDPMGSMGSRRRGEKKKGRAKVRRIGASTTNDEVSETTPTQSVVVDSEEAIVTQSGGDEKSENLAPPLDSADGVVVSDEERSKYILESPFPSTYPSVVQGAEPVLLSVPMSSFTEHSAAGLCCIFDLIGTIDALSLQGGQLKRTSSGDVLELLISGSFQFFEMKLEEALDRTTVGMACTRSDCSTKSFTCAADTPLSGFCTVSSCDLVALSDVHYCVADSPFAVEALMVSVEDAVASCTLRPYMMESPTSIAMVIRTFEKHGLRLCNMRSVQMLPNVKYGTHLHPDVKAHLASQMTAVSSLSLGFHRAGGNAAETLRDVLGPEDPLLARRTDPKSLRATMGLDRQHNVSFPISHSASRVLGDWLFMFGPRRHHPFATTGSMLLPKARSVVVGFSYQYHKALESGIDEVCEGLSALQSRCLKWLLPYRIKESHTVTWSDFKNIFPGAAASKRNIDGAPPRIYSVFHFPFCGGDLCIEEMRDSLLQCSRRDKSTDWHMEAFLECIDRVASVVPDKAGKNALLALKDIENKRFETHEDIGLQDTIAIRGDCQRVIQVLTAIPGPCRAHVLGIKGRLAKMTVIVRGTNIFSTIDSTLSMIQSLDDEDSSKSPSAPVKLQEPLPVVLKGKRCLNAITQDFSEERLFLAIAQHEMELYVPNYALPSGNTSTLSNSSSPALYLPGQFDCLAVVLIPWDKVTAKGGSLARIMKRFEREEFKLIRVGSTVLSGEVLEMLSVDYYNEYGLNADPVKALDGTSCMTLLLRGNSILRRLRYVIGHIGKVVDDNPSTLNATLQSHVIATLSVSSSDTIIHACFKYQASLWMQSRDHSFQGDGPPANTFLEHICEWDSKVSIAHSKANENREVRTIEDSFGVTSLDVTTIALTGALLSHTPLSTIFEQLSREGFVVTNVRSLQFSAKGASELLSLAGQSTLALKCGSVLLCAAPVLLLAVEGPPRAIMKFKQLEAPKTGLPGFSLVPQYSSERQHLWKLSSGDIGVVAASSSKLSHAILLRFFPNLNGNVSFVNI